jgi:hypothetical protein
MAEPVDPTKVAQFWEDLSEPLRLILTQTYYFQEGQYWTLPEWLPHLRISLQDAAILDQVLASKESDGCRFLRRIPRESSRGHQGFKYQFRPGMRQILADLSDDWYVTVEFFDLVSPTPFYELVSYELLQYRRQLSSTSSVKTRCGGVTRIGRHPNS